MQKMIAHVDVEIVELPSEPGSLWIRKVATGTMFVTLADGTVETHTIHELRSLVASGQYAYSSVT